MFGRSELKFIGNVDAAGKEKAKLRVFPEFCTGLKGIDEFSHIIVLYWIHLRDNEDERRVLHIIPRRHTNDVEVGVFACRSPSRPNPIGLCIVELSEVEGCILTVRGLDAFENSPIIDIKPYIPRADAVPTANVPKWTDKGPST